MKLDARANMTANPSGWPDKGSSGTMKSMGPMTPNKACCHDKKGAGRKSYRRMK